MIVKKKLGRKKNPTTVKLERRIKQLEEQLEAQVPEPDKSMTEKAYGYTYDPETKEYRLHTIAFNPETKMCAYEGVQTIATSFYRASYESKKLTVETLRDLKD